MKRKICFLLILSVLLGTIPVLAYQDTAESSYKKAIEYTTMIGLLQGENDLFRPDSPTKREEAAAVLCKLGCVDAVPAEQKAADVSSDRWSYNVINTAVALKMMALNEDGRFYPERPITVKDLKNPLISILGYARIPNTSAAMQAEAKLMKGLSLTDSQEMNRGQMAQMLYNALDIEMVTEEIGGKGQYVMSGQTLLGWYLEQKDMLVYRGVLEATENATLNVEKPAKDGYIVIDGELFQYEGGANLTGMLGRRVDFAAVNTDDSVRTVIYVNPFRNEEFTFESDDLIKITKSGAEYIDPETDETEKLNFSDDLYFVYNNRAVLGFSDADLMTGNGTYTLVDNDDDGTIDVVLVAEYESFVVKNVSTALSAIYLEDGRYYQGRNNISLDRADRDFTFELTDAEGKAAALADIAPYDAVTVMGDREGKRLSVIVAKNKVYGRLSEITADYVVLEGEEYEIGKDANGVPVLNCDLSATGNYIIDAFGNIIGFEETGESKNYGFVAGIDSDSSIASDLKVKIIRGGRITELEKENSTDKPKYSVGNQELQVYTLADKVRVDNRKLTANEKMQMLNGAAIAFNANGSEITKIELLTTDQTLQDRAFNPDIRSFGGLFYIDENTNVMCYPENADASDDDYYTMLTLEASSKYKILGYDIDPATKVAKAAVLYENMKIDEPGVITKSSKFSVVKKTRKIIREDEETMLITLYNNGQEKNLYTKVSERVGEIADRLKFGDVIYYSVNSMGLIDNIEYVENITNDTQPFHKNVRSANERIYGTLYTIGRKELSPDTNTEVNTFGVSLSGDGSDRIDFTVDNTQTPNIYLVDSKRETITPVTMQDLAPYNEFGTDAAKVFIGKKNYKISSIVTVQ